MFLFMCFKNEPYFHNREYADGPRSQRTLCDISQLEHVIFVRRGLAILVFGPEHRGGLALSFPYKSSHQ